MVLDPFITRNIPETFSHLGLVRPTRKEVRIAIGLGTVQVGVFQVVDVGIIIIGGEFFGWQMTDTDVVELLFTALHAFQYNWDKVLSVILAGIVFAIFRRYHCITVSAVTHTVYDLILIQSLFFGLGF